MVLPGLLPSGMSYYPADTQTGTLYTYGHRKVRGVGFANQLCPYLSPYCLRMHRLPDPPDRVDVAVDGSHGLSLAMDAKDGPVVCVEAAVLYTMMQARAAGTCEPPPQPSAAQTFTCGTANGWVGFVTGQFFQYMHGDNTQNTVAEAVLQDRYGALMSYGGVPMESIAAVSEILHRNAWCGAPDLTLWNVHEKELMLVEVKTATDKLSDVQKRVLWNARAHADCNCRVVKVRDHWWI